MFYEAEVLCQRSSLGKVWIAAHWDKKLSKNAISQYSETDIVKEASTFHLAPLDNLFRLFSSPTSSEYLSYAALVYILTLALLFSR